MKLALSARAKLSSRQIEELVRLGYETETFTDFPKKRFDVYIGYMEPLTVKERYQGASFIHLLSAGYDKLDLDDLNKNKIFLTNSKGVYDAPIAEYALYCVLDYCKKGRFFSRQQENHIWMRVFPTAELQMLKIGILGTGSIATACAKRFKALGSQVIGVNRTGRKAACFDSVYQIHQVDHFLSEVEVVINTLPLNSDTRGLLDYHRLSCLKDSSALICVGRGKTLVEEDLRKILEKKNIEVYMDVFEKEPLEQGSWLYDCDNIHLTPHISFSSSAAYQRMSDLAFENARRFIKKEQLINIVG
ncbi:MAG: NAD(P)-binding domain-containing protein [Lachnospiraceae bacterium]|nr:NAD(P)-binding domain-containing protein [Lachnospiraceae bacterium]